MELSFLIGALSVFSFPVNFWFLDDGVFVMYFDLVLLSCTGEGSVEPSFLFLLSVGQVDHEGVEHVCVTNQESEVVISAGSLLGELASGTVSEEVSLSDAHLLLLDGRSVDGLFR